MLAGFQSFSNVQPSTYITIPFSRYTLLSQVGFDWLHWLVSPVSSIACSLTSQYSLFCVAHTVAQQRSMPSSTSTSAALSVYVFVFVYDYVQLAITTICACCRSFSSYNVHSNITGQHLSALWLWRIQCQGNHHRPVNQPLVCDCTTETHSATS